MSDDQRPSRRDPDDFSEFGSLFGDTPPTENIEQVSAQRPEPIDDGWGQRTSEQRRVPSDHARPASSYDDFDHGAGYEGLADDGSSRSDVPPADDSGSIQFGDSDTGPMPHWTEPPTGEVPRLEPRAAVEDGPLEDDGVDVWSSFSSDSPVWKDDQPDAGDLSSSGPVPAQPAADTDVDAPTGRHPEVSGQHPRVTGQHARATEQHPRTTGQHRRVVAQAGEAPERPNRITIGTDPSGVTRREPPSRRGRGGRSAARRPVSHAPASSGRDMPTAIAVGVLLAAAFVGALIFDPRVFIGLVAALLGLASIEFYGRVAEKGYRPAFVPGVAMCVSAPLAAYWVGDGALPLVIAFGFMAASFSFAGASGVEAGPLPNASVTTVGMIWIGLLGSFAALIMRFSTANGSGLEIADNWGTDTLFLLALGVALNDIGALIAGSLVGRTPLRAWISPNKTVEGLIGGTALTLAALLLIGVFNLSDTWSSMLHLLLLGLVISVMAPMGDTVESMFKRNLDIKDFGTIIRGHGGVLDRFDGFLFTLPAVYYLTLVLEPWTQYSG